MRDEFPQLELQAPARVREVAHVGLLEIDVLPVSERIAKEPRRGRDAGDRAAHGDVHAEARIARLRRRLLQHQLGDVDLERLVIQIEDPVAVYTGERTVEAVRVAGGDEPVERDRLIPRSSWRGILRVRPRHRPGAQAREDRDQEHPAAHAHPTPPPDTLFPRAGTHPGPLSLLQRSRGPASPC